MVQFNQSDKLISYYEISHVLKWPISKTDYLYLDMPDCNLWPVEICFNQDKYEQCPLD